MKSANRITFKKVKKIVLFAFLMIVQIFFLSSKSEAQISYGARSAALNHSVTALNNNTWALFANPATINETQREVSFYYVRYYGLDEISDVAATGSYPMKLGVLSAGIHTYGFDLYRETDLHLAWMIKYKQIKTAVRLHYNHIAFPSPYGSDGALGIDLGVFFPVTENLDIGATAINLNRPTIGVNPEDLPQLMSVGFAYKPLDKGLILVDVLKDVRYPISTRVGVEYPLIDMLVLRAGVGNRPVNTTFGAGVLYKQWNVNFSVEKHQDLGWSPGLDLSFTW